MTEQELIALRLYRQHLTNPAPGGGDLPGFKRNSGSVPFQQPPCPGHPGMRRIRVEPGTGESWTLRGTIHVFREEDLPLYLHEGRRHALRPCDTLEADGWITRERKDYFAALILDTLTGGPATREALRQTCRSKGLTDREEESVFQPWGGTIRPWRRRGRLSTWFRRRRPFAWRLPLHRWGGGGSLAGNTSPVFYILRPCQPAGRSLLPGSSSEGAETADAGLGP